MVLNEEMKKNIYVTQTQPHEQFCVGDIYLFIFILKHVHRQIEAETAVRYRRGVSRDLPDSWTHTEPLKGFDDEDDRGMCDSSDDEDL